MNRSSLRSVLFPVIAAVVLGAPGCTKPKATDPTVAEVNGAAIKVAELREFLGVRGGLIPVAGVTTEQKKEALDRLIAGRLLAQDARAQGLDNTDEFRNYVKTGEQTALITALFRKEVASKGIVSKEETQAEAKKMRAADNTLSEEHAGARAQRSLAEGKIRKIQEDLIAAANKEFPTTIQKEMVDRIVRGEVLPDEAVLATVAGDNVTYGEVKQAIRSMGGTAHEDPQMFRNPVVINRVLTREATGSSLVAYAKKQALEGTEWLKSAREDIERSILIDMVAGKIVEKESKVTDKEIDAAYKEHAEMFTQHGKKVPLSAVKEQLRGFLLNEKRKSAMNAYIEELKKKAKITVNEKVLGEV